MINIRYNIFETNSSSVHTLTLCREEDYDKWNSGEYLLRNDCNFSDENLPQFIPKDKLEEYDPRAPYTMEKGSYYEPYFFDKNGEGVTYDDIMYLTPEQYESYYENLYFYEERATIDGIKVVAFGRHGYDG